MNCPYCGTLIRDDESTCDSLDCSPYDCDLCDDKGWVPARWLKTPKDATQYPKLREECPDCLGVAINVKRRSNHV